jgi:translation initiation factor IF-2
VGDPFDAVADDKTAKKVAAHRAEKNRETERSRNKQTRLMDFLNKKKDEAAIKELNLIVKGDVRGSVEAVNQILEQQTTRKVRVNIVQSGVGAINESDVNTSVATGAKIIGFNVKPDAKASSLARHEQVDVRSYRVIYDIVEEMKVAMADLLEPIEVEEELGEAEVRQIFNVPKLGAIAGSYINDGKFIKSGRVRVMRQGKEMHDGPIVSLRRFKDDVKEVSAGYECGIGVGGFRDYEEGDLLCCYEVKRVRAELDEPLVNLAAEEKQEDQQASAPA